MAAIPLLAFYFFANLMLLISSADENKHHPRCQPFHCGEHGPFTFPFTNKTDLSCGIYRVDCSEPVPRIQFKQGGYWYKIQSITQGYSVIIDDAELGMKIFDPYSCESIESFSFASTSVLSNASIHNSWSLFNCSRSLGVNPPTDSKLMSCPDYDIYRPPPNAGFPFAQHCSAIQLPIDDLRTSNNRIVLTPHFSVDVSVLPVCANCHFQKYGECGINLENEFTCFRKGKSRAVLAAILAIAFIVVGVAVILILCKLKKISLNAVIFFWAKQNQAHQNIEAFLRNCGPLQVRRYSYLDVKKMTNSFKEKLGKGGFGDVYKGKLNDGCFVAVKILNRTKGEDGQEFINEVATISRTSHVNIVTLLGFCFQGDKRALIYEFMPNGSLEKFVFDENVAAENIHLLNWEKLYQISVGIARGLEYLHRGCNSRIVHFDIKPHNILLDADFVPKISDFGLAKICTRKESVISMVTPRGTIGYIAPEVFSRNFGEVSHKSDVYSYGMRVLDMVGGRRNVNVTAENSSEIYFPHWIHKRLELSEDLGLKKIVNEDDKLNVRKMIVVSLWCIQTNPSNRPTMSKVIEMLEGSIDSLQIPPKPLLSSPSRSSPANSSTFESILT